MLKPDKLEGEEKKSPKKQHRQNGRVEELLSQQAELLGQVVQKLQDHDAQFEELSKNQDYSGKSKLLVSERLYNTDREHRSEMTNLPTMGVIEPFALATTLGSLFDKDVVEGRVSLADNYMDETKKLFRGYKGGLQQLAADHAREKENVNEGLGSSEAVDLGKGF